MPGWFFTDLNLLRSTAPPFAPARPNEPPPGVRGTAQLQPAALLRAALRRRADEGL